ncbi:MAG: aminotransferase class V-fold PLP-dependent enzyme [Gammaproteobacteria bacterium]|nr:aminotransferase class V-fold PLP-dependent enzyme [Gammaproteobacteria bacterium]MCP4088943.1 aminotransferase class V-fold PLP-dependent enzyme [Gammaproteobacteria bacterium]MCP4274960.1 aminotransferase class V-fold PLP-dependent enzyme [Gammaproteobacteria bacterium]MCP4831973.1 aminotransferase class V-fold PLP-dependent enzyme [Gammaproteobacteria bacterium]MCP4929408.1 aminotransferase class V-fold PLP-dependent enzyme [Gammaproteobacteria bacterium]
MKETVYLDYAATTPVDPRVRDCMVMCLEQSEGFGNPASSTHVYGEQAAVVIRQAAIDVATLINASPDELVWTSGATESDNLAVLGAAHFKAMKGRHIVTVVTEHKAVLESCAQLEQEGFTVTYLRPDGTGLISAKDLAAALRPDTTLVSVMHANNETGVVQDIGAIGSVCRQHDVLLHVDAAQSIGKLPVDVIAQQIDLLSFNAHKACGPKGVGALYLNRERIRRIEPLLYGGGQQRGIRPGTLAVHQIAGMGEALRILGDEMEAEASRVSCLRDRLWQGIGQLPGVVLNGHPEQRLCSILNVSVAGVEGESLQFALDGLAVSSGSACNSSSGEPSYVLRSLGLSDQLAEASIRFSLGRFTTEADIDQAIKLFTRALAYLQALSCGASMKVNG